MKKPVTLLATAVLLAGGLSACGGGGGSGDKTLTVLAAASLTESFDELAKTYEKEHDGVDVKLVYDSSATLAEQAEQGAPGDVLATADKRTMDDASSKGGTSGTPEQFATNVIQLAVPADNPAGITSFTDLGKKGVKYVVCVKTAPCGASSVPLLSKNKITQEPVSEEVDVKSVLAKVTSGEADAGMVYRTDVVSAGSKVKGIDVPGSDDPPNTYWVAQTKNAKAAGLAKDWITLMTSTQGQKVLASHGFGAAQK